MTIRELQQEFKVGNLAHLDLNRLPNEMAKMVENLKLVEKRTPIDSLLLDFLIKLSQYLNFRKLKLQVAPETLTTINTYAMIFMESGGGKDRPLIDIDNLLFPDIEKQVEEQIKIYEEKRLEEVKTEAEKFPKGAARNKYIQDNRPRNFPLTISNATPEGLTLYRDQMDKAGFGGTFVKISEFGDYVTTSGAVKDDLLSSLKELFEHGSSDVKATVIGSSNRRIKGVASTVLCHSTMTKLQNDEGRSKLLQLLGGGWGRRLYICYPEVERKDVSLDYDARAEKEREEKDQAYLVLCGESREYLNDIYGVGKPFVSEVVTMDDDAEYLFNKYDDFSNSITFPEFTPEEIVAERCGRAFKMIKLAALLALFSHMNNKVVTKLDVERAIYLTEYYGKYMDKLMENPQYSDIDKLYNYFIQNEGIWLSKGDIRRKKFVDKREFLRWLPEALEEIGQIADGKYELQVNKQRKGVYYRLIKESKTDITKIKMSYSNDKPQDRATHFSPIEVPFEQIDKVIEADGDYSAAQFKDEYRKDDNVIPGQNIIILDIDDGWTIKEALAFLKEKNLLAKIFTTRSHQKAKDKKPACDRFRILLPTKTEITLGKLEYSEMMKGVMAFFLNKPDQSCKNIGRMFFSHKGEMWDSEGTELFDWRNLSSVSEISKVTQSYPNNFPSNGQTFKELWDARDINEIKRRLDWDNGFRDGDRNNFMNKKVLWIRDDRHLSLSDAKQLFGILNAGQLSQQEMDDTIFSPTKDKLWS